MNKLRIALRERTQPAHERLDGLFSSLDIKRRDDYARFLAAQAVAFEAIEKRLDEVDAQAVIPDWPERRRAESIRLDLDALAEPSAPAGQAVDWIEDRASVLGTAYVLEGSRLGGKMLLRHVMTSEDGSVTGAVRFLSHGENQRLWPSFDALLASSDLSEAEVDRMVDSATRTFEYFETSARRVL